MAGFLINNVSTFIVTIVTVIIPVGAPGTYFTTYTAFFLILIEPRDRNHCPLHSTDQETVAHRFGELV